MTIYRSANMADGAAVDAALAKAISALQQGEQVTQLTRAQLNEAAAENALLQGEPYLITDELTLAIGTSVNGYVTMTAVSPESSSDAIKIAIVSALPGTPDANTLYFVTG